MRDAVSRHADNRITRCVVTRCTPASRVETEHPVGAPDRQHLPAGGAERAARQHHGVAVAHLGDRAARATAVDALGDELEIALVVERGDRRRVLAHAEVADRCEGDDRDVVGQRVVRDVGVGHRDREVERVERDPRADRLVPDDAVVGAEHVAVPQAGAVEQPVVRPVHDEAGHAARRRLPEAGVQPVHRRRPEQAPLGASGRRDRHHIPVTADGSSVAIGSVSCAEYLWHTIDVPSRSSRTRQNIVLPEKDA